MSFLMSCPGHRKDPRPVRLVEAGTVNVAFPARPARDRETARLRLTTSATERSGPDGPTVRSSADLSSSARPGRQDDALGGAVEDAGEGGVPRHQGGDQAQPTADFGHAR